MKFSFPLSTDKNAVSCVSRVSCPSGVPVVSGVRAESGPGQAEGPDLSRVSRNIVADPQVATAGHAWTPTTSAAGPEHESPEARVESSVPPKRDTRDTWDTPLKLGLRIAATETAEQRGLDAALMEDIIERAAIIEAEGAAEMREEAEAIAVRLVQCRNCRHFTPDTTQPLAGIGNCAVNGWPQSQATAWPVDRWAHHLDTVRRCCAFAVR